MRFFNNIKWCRSREARTGRDRTCRVGLGCEILEPRQLLAITAPVLDSEAETQVEVSQESLDQIIPVLDSLPGAPKTLYLDFDGHDGVWEGQPAHTPQFSLDDDRNNFSPQEIAAMEEIWQRVAEDYSPFNINVSTVEPPELAEGASVYDAIGVSVRVAIGGDWTQWLGEEASGIALRGSFYNGSPNTVYAFDRKILCEDPADCGVFTPRYIADVVSHEAAHSFGLKHQSYWGQSDIRGYHMVHEYHPGNSELVPIMGGAAKAGPGPRSVWWVGTNQNDKPQNDIASLLSNLGERPDDHKDRSSEATVISLQNPTKGVITFGTGEAPDVDMFVVSVPAGLGEQLNIAVHVNPVGPNLDARLEVYTAYSRGPIAVDDPENSLNASVSVPLGETYWIKVMGHRAADPLTDMGQYTLNFSVQPFVFDFITKNDPFETICDPLAPYESISNIYDSFLNTESPAGQITSPMLISKQLRNGSTAFHLKRLQHNSNSLSSDNVRSTPAFLLGGLGQMSISPFEWSIESSTHDGTLDAVFEQGLDEMFSDSLAQGPMISGKQAGFSGSAR